MGEISDDMVDGTVCQLCGMFFEDENGEIYTHDFPVVCWDCWKDLDKRERREYQRALVKTI